mmetsp:Transcript_42649/g.102841  ORF Transcript_42649/g.102841 Transcript_42649/m.102841 type:complete len:540 (-) Transcript_42649:1309-2928(-)
MDGETFNLPPSGAVIIGARSLISLVGLSTALCGYWYMEHKFDNEGAAAVGFNAGRGSGGGKSEATESYVEMEGGETPAPAAAKTTTTTEEQINFHPNGARELVRVSTEDSKSTGGGMYKNMVEDPIINPFASCPSDERPNDVPELSPEAQIRLYDSYPFPKVMLVGFGIWCISFLFDPSIGSARFYWNFWNLSSFFLAASIGPIMAYPIRVNTLNRDIDRKKKSITALVVVSILLCFTATADFIVDAPWFFNVFGMLFMLLSYQILRRSRRMGLSWDLQAKPADDVTVQNLGTVFLVFGVFLFWVGTNGVLNADMLQSYLPLFISSRCWCVFVAGMLLIVPSMFAMDLAFDKGSSVVTYYNDYITYLDGRTMSKYAKEIKLLDISPLTRLMETPFFFFCGWALMTVCVFMPFGATGLTIQKFCTFAVCLVIGPVYAFLVLPAFWRADSSSYQQYTYIYYGLMILLATAIGVGGGVELILSMTGVALILVGQRRDLYERKRGITWLKDQTTSTNPQVYGLGLPLFVLGWVFLCLAMCVPM